MTGCSRCGCGVLDIVESDSRYRQGKCDSCNHLVLVEAECYGIEGAVICADCADPDEKADGEPLYGNVFTDCGRCGYPLHDEEGL